MSLREEKEAIGCCGCGVGSGNVWLSSITWGRTGGTRVVISRGGIVEGASEGIEGVWGDGRVG